MAHAFPCFTPNPVELCSGRPTCGATQSFGEKLTLAQVSARISFQQPLDPYLRLCAGIPPPSGQDEESPAKQLSKSLQEYKRVTGEHRALISKKIRLQAKSEALKKQFKEAVDQLTAVSGKIEAVEQEIEKAHAQVKEKINAPRQPRITEFTSLLKSRRLGSRCRLTRQEL